MTIRKTTTLVDPREIKVSPGELAEIRADLAKAGLL